MADKQQTIPLSPNELVARTKLSDNFYSVFSNHVRVAASPTEFRLFFGESYPTATGEIVVTENLSVVLTPIQAKLTLGVLSETIQKVESLHGVIPTIQPSQQAEATQPATSATEYRK